jgi:FixJ family two-component response regulator
MMNQKTPSNKQSTIYVVDDDESMRRALIALLESVDYAARAFASPTQFLQQFDSQAAGCLVLDIRMPEMSGFEVQKALNARGAILPVIFITGHGDVPMAVQAMKEGAFDFIQKPFRDQELLDKINAALQQDQENRQALSRKDGLRKRHNNLTPTRSRGNGNDCRW